MLPTTSEDWAKLVLAALETDPDILPEQLLLVQDSAGRPIHDIEPPHGIVTRIGAVLMLLYPDGTDLRIPLTVRSDQLLNHRNEVSLPGGATDPEDRDEVATALRECQEEIGVDPQTIVILGTLTPVYIPPSNFYITPVVGYSSQTPQLRLNPAEVSTVIGVTLRELLDPASVLIEQRVLRGVEACVPFFSIAGFKVWGATALILSQMVARIRSVLEVVQQ